MAERRRATEKIQRVARDALRLLRENEDISLDEIATRCHVSRETTKRAMDWLREQGADAVYDATSRAWKLKDKTFALPLLDPTIEDLQAALTAAGLLQALHQNQAAERAWAIFCELEAQLYPTKGRAIHRESLRVTQAAAPLCDGKWMLALLRAARRQVVRFSYHSPWTDEVVAHIFEPWQVGLHEGALYIRGYSRSRRAPRTFNVAHISILELIQGDKPRTPVPRKDVWGDADPWLGIDVDRPGIAKVGLRGAIARWVAGVLWHKDQKDRWLEVGEHLERQVPFRSCREFARRLMSVADGIEHLEPPELASELERLLREGLQLRGVHFGSGNSSE
jgi:predicted DNA-binding transcriptional regulator YafY